MQPVLLDFLDQLQAIVKLHRLGEVAVRADLVAAGDVFLAVSHSGESRDVLEPLRRASAQAATTVVITNHPMSTAARLADFVLVSAGRETTFRPGAMASRISQLVVVDCLFVCVAQRTFDVSSRALRLTHQALESDRAS